MADQIRTFDTYGRAFLRSLLSEEPEPSTVLALRHIMATEGASYTVDDVARDLGITLPAVPETIPERRPRPVRPARKVRTRLCL